MDPVPGGEALIYLDHQASTPLDPQVLQAMLPFMSDSYGNASSVHGFGRKVAEGVAGGRSSVAEAIGARPEEIVFTSGATEANNLAISGVVNAAAAPRKHVITVATEHKSVLEPIRFLERQGVEVTVLPVDSDGLVDLDRLAAELRPETVLVSMMAVNNEVGVVQPIAEVARIAKRGRALVHCDAAQAMGVIAIDVEDWEVDLLSLSAHKFYGPSGVGALYVRSLPAFPVQPMLLGGSHEKGLRSGTLNAPGIAGMGVAAQIAVCSREADQQRIAILTHSFLDQLRARVEGVALNGSFEHRAAGNLSLRIGGVETDQLLARLPGLALSTGSACTASVPGPSHVLLALGLTPEQAASTIRVSFGRWTTDSEIERAAAQIATAVQELRALATV